MSQKEGGAKLGYLLAGLGLGAVVGIMTAPRPGQETREHLRQRAQEGRDCAEDMARQIRSRAEELINQVNQVVADQRDLLSAAIEEGRHTYWREKLKQT